jgi:hypothetical protein
MDSQPSRDRKGAGFLQEASMLKRYAMIGMLVGWSCWSAQAVEEQHGFVVGTVQKVDSAAKTVAVKTADGTVHTLHLAKGGVVHGAQASATGAKDAFQGLKEGSQVAVHYTAKGSVESAEEIDNIGKDGLKAVDVTATHVDRGAKTLTVKTAAGAEDTFRLTDRAAKDAGKDVAEGADKSAKVTVYYTEEGGRKVAHFFQKAF